MIMSSLKNQADIVSWPLHFSFSPVMSNIKEIFGEQNFLLYLKNSCIVTFSAVFLSLVIGLPAAYSIARFNQRRLLMMILAARLMPAISFAVPWYLIISRLGLFDSYIALILSHILITMPVVVWIMSAYFKNIPVEIEDSAMVDGATRQRAFMSIILPISIPGIITAAALGFIFSWNNFMFSQVLSMEKTRTLPVAVNYFISNAETNWGGIMAAAVVSLTPVITIAMFFQNYVIKGFTAGVVKD
jgi:multiple sugar transport system permease protein